MGDVENQNSGTPVSGLEERTVSVGKEHGYIQRTRKMKTREEQLEKHISDLEKKNKFLVSRCIDLNTTNKKLVAENTELHNKLNSFEQIGAESKTVQHQFDSEKISFQQIASESKATHHQLNSEKNSSQQTTSESKAVHSQLNSVNNSFEQIASESKATYHKIKSEKNSFDEVAPEAKTTQRTESTEYILNTQELVTLWNELSSIPLPVCNCNKLHTKRKMPYSRTNKYKAHLS